MVFWANTPPTARKSRPRKESVRRRRLPEALQLQAACSFRNNGYGLAAATATVTWLLVFPPTLIVSGTADPIGALAIGIAGDPWVGLVERRFESVRVQPCQFGFVNAMVNGGQHDLGRERQ